MRCLTLWAILMEAVIMGSMADANEAKTLLTQKETIALSVERQGDKAAEVTLTSEPKQTTATAVRISGFVRTEDVTGVRDVDFMVVTNLTYEKTPVFWYTILYPETGTNPWRYMEKLIQPRLPIQRIDMRFRLAHQGKAWFRDFKVEEVAAWKDAPELVVATLGDSTGVMAYLPDELTVWGRLEMLLRDRFHDRNVRVRCLAESGDYLKQLLASGRLERELATLPRCDIMLIRYGLNDNGHKIPPAEFKAQLAETAGRVQARFPRVQIVLATTIPPGAAAYDAMTRQLAGERGWPLIDVAAFLENEAGRGNSDWHTGPGRKIGLPAQANPADDPTGLKGNKHPNAYGGQLIAEQEFRALAPLVEKALAAGQGAK